MAAHGLSPRNGRSANGRRAKAEQLRVGVIGCGYWGPKHVRVLHSLPTVSQVCAIDARGDVLAAIHRSFPAVECFDNLDDALPHLDALVVATPASTHFAIADQALAAGKHVLVEKPFVTTVADGDRLLERADSTGAVLMAGHTFEYNPAVVRLRDAIQTGELGDVYYIDSARLNLGLYQRDVDVILDLAPHDISIMNFVLDAQPNSVEAWGSRHAHAWHTDVAYIRLEYRDLGVWANIHVSWLDPCKVRQVTAVGDRKMVVYNDLTPEEPIRMYDRGVNRPLQGSDPTQAPMSYRYGDIVVPFTPQTEPLMVQDEHFVDCVLNGKTPQSDGECGVAVVRVIEAARQSVQDGGRIELPEPTTPRVRARRGSTADDLHETALTTIARR